MDSPAYCEKDGRAPFSEMSIGAFDNISQGKWSTGQLFALIMRLIVAFYMKVISIHNVIVFGRQHDNGFHC